MEQILQSCLVSQWFLFSWGLWYSCPSIFQSTFLQAETVVKSPSWVEIWNSISSGFFFFCFAFETPSKLFSILFSLFLLFGSDTYKHAYRKVVCIFLVNYSSKFPWNSKIQRKIKEKCIFNRSADLNLKIVRFGVYHRATPRKHWSKQTVKKLNLWENKAL